MSRSLFFFCCLTEMFSSCVSDVVKQASILETPVLNNANECDLCFPSRRVFNDQAAVCVFALANDWLEEITFNLIFHPETNTFLLYVTCSSSVPLITVELQP